MTQKLKVVFAGTSPFAAAALKAIQDAGFIVPLVLTQPDRLAGRGMKYRALAVKQYALEAGLALIQPSSLHVESRFSEEASAAIEYVRATPHDVMVVAAYGLLLPQTVLDLAPYGCINIHASLLPRWRGAAPIQRAIEAGDAETGITLMQMDAGLDTGPILRRAAVPIHAIDTTATLTQTLTALGAQQIVDALKTLQKNGALPCMPQSAQGVCYAPKISTEEAVIDWRRSADALARQIRAFDPMPGVHTMLAGMPIKLWAAEPVMAETSSACPGEMIEVTPHGVAIACGAGALRVTQWQRPGGKRMATQPFISGFPLHAGQRFT